MLYLVASQYNQDSKHSWMTHKQTTFPNQADCRIWFTN